MPRKERVVDIFVASPGDVAEERDVVKKVIDQFNQAWSRQLGLRLVYIGWDTDVHPAVGSDVQDVITKQTPPYDIFIGLMWARFGTPTPRAGSGTEEEFDIAYERFKEHPDSLKIMLYFKVTSVDYHADPSQLQKVHEFRDKVKSLGPFSEFRTLEQLRDLLTIHLPFCIQRNWLRRTVAAQRVANKESKGVRRARAGETMTDEQLGYEYHLMLFRSGADLVAVLLERMAVHLQDFTGNMRIWRQKADALKIKAGQRSFRVELAVFAAEMGTGLRNYGAVLKCHGVLVGETFRQTFRSFSVAVHLSLGLAPLREDEKTKIVARFADLRTHINALIVQVRGMRVTIDALAFSDDEFSRARQIVVEAMDYFADVLTTSEQMVSDIEDAIRLYVSWNAS